MAVTSPGGHVADIHVDVHPEATRFKEELKRALADIDDVKVLVRANIAGFHRDLQNQADRMTAIKVPITADVVDFRRKLQQRLNALAPIKIGVTPDLTGFKTRLRDDLAASNLPNATVKIDGDNSAALTSVAAVETAIKALPTTIHLDVDTGAAAGSIATLRGAIAGLSAGSVNVDLDIGAAMAKVATLQAALAAVSAGSVSIRVTMPNATSVGQRIGRAAARAFYTAFRTAMASMPPVGPPTGSSAASGAAGSRSGGAFAEGFRNAVRAGIQSLPEPTIGPARNLVDQQIRDLRLDLERLSNQRVGIDIDATTALRELDRIELELRSLAHNSPDVQIRLDTARAEAQLARFREQIANLGPDPGTAARQGAVSGGAFGNAYARGVEAATRGLRPVHITANTDDVTRDIELVRQRLASLSTQRVGIDIDAGFALAEVQRLEAELRRLGEMSPDIAVRADTAAAAAQLARLQQQLRDLGHTRATPTVDVNTDRAVGDLDNMTSSSGRSTRAIHVLIAAGIAIGPAIVPAAAAAVAAIGALGPAALIAGAGIGVTLLAFSGVSDAVKAMGAAQSGAAKTGATLANQQKQVAAANDQVRSAAAGVESAERNLAAALRDSLRAQRDIIQAREDAADAYEDLNSQAANNALQIRQAKLSIADAEKELAAVLGLPVDDRRRVEAQLAYDEAKQQLADLTTRQGRLAEEQKQAAKVGIEGSEQVQSAQERAADAQERIRDAERALTQARQQAVAAQRDLTAAMVTTGATGGAAVDTLAQKMAALSPAGQKFAIFLHGLKDEFKTIKGAAEAGLFPGLQAGIEALLPVFPKIALFVGRLAEAMGGLFRSAGQALASPFWTDFFDYMGKNAGPILDALGGILGGLAKGFASLLVAFTPFSTLFMQGMAGVAQAFADWAAGLAGSNGFTAFIEYVKTEGPKIVGLFGALVVSLVKLGIAFAPLGALVLDGLVAFFEFLARQSPGTLVAIAAGIGAIALAITGFALAPIALVAALVAVAAGVAYAYNRFEWLRTGVDAVFGFLKGVVTTFVDAFVKGGDDITRTGFLGIIQLQAQHVRDMFEYVKAGVVSFFDAFKRGGDQVAQGGFAAYMANIGMVARNVFDWLRTVGIPALQEFATWIGPKLQVAAQIAWAVLETFFAVLNRVFGFLWEHRDIIASTLSGGVTYVQFAFTLMAFYWDSILKPVFAAIGWWVQKVVGPVFEWLLNSVVKPVWAGIQQATSAAWTIIQGIFALAAAGIRTFGGVWSWLYTNAVKPAWAGIKLVLDVAWAGIQVIFGLIQIAIKVLGGVWSWLFTNAVQPAWNQIQLAVSNAWTFLQGVFALIAAGIRLLAGVFSWLYDSVVKPVWDRAVAAISAGWDRIRPVFEMFGSFISQYVAPKFASAVDGLKDIWSRLGDAAKQPIRFIVNAVLNDGLLAAYNFLADKFNVSPKNVRVDLPKGFARGGPVWGPGTGTSDSIPAMLSAGEYIIPAEIVKTFGVRFFDQMIGKRRYPYPDAGEMRFAGGGIVDWAKSAWDTVTDPIGTLKDKALGLLGGIPNAGLQMAQVAVGVGKHLIGGMVDWAKGKFLPKVFTSSGGGGGNAAAIAANATPGFPPWPARHPGSGGPSGDSGVWRSIVALIKSTGPLSGSFGNSYRPGDPLWHGAGHAVDWMGFEQDALATRLASMGPLELIHRTRARDYAFTRGRNKGSFSAGLMQNHRNHIHIAMAGGGYVGGGGDGASLSVPYLHRDTGGMVPPGLSLVDNSTGKDEWMFNDAQVKEIVGATAGRGGGNGVTVHVEHLHASDDTPWTLAQNLDWIGKTRGGR